MSLEQTIKHYYELIEEEQCYMRAEEYLQLVKWLEELRDYRIRDYYGKGNQKCSNKGNRPKPTTGTQTSTLI